jgi:hypothetical protein
MSSYAYRFVGQETLPSRLTEFDRRQFFELNAGDIQAIRDRFRTDHRAAAALQLLFLRACGRPADRFTTLPRSLLRYVFEALGFAPLTIASLRSLYRRRPTLYEHQLWAKSHLGLKDVNDETEAELKGVLKLAAAEVAHPEEVAIVARQWLYDRRLLIPSSRRLQDWAREAFSGIEAQILGVVLAAVPPATIRRCRDSVYSLRAHAAETHLEWLRTPSKRHGRSSLAEIIEKIRYLKDLTVHEWSLDDIAIAKQHAYAQRVQARRPVKTRQIKEGTQTIELVCFLRVGLPQLTEVAIQQSNRRGQQLFREAAQKAQLARGERRPICGNACKTPARSCAATPSLGRPGAGKPISF